MHQGRLFVLSGPSGVGKGTICTEIVKDRNVMLSVSMTTRAIRGNEIPGESYYFVSDEEFDKVIAEGGFLEYAGIYGHRYGTPKQPVLQALSKGIDVILEIEMQGAQNIKKNFPDAVLIFVLPPSLEVLDKRLNGRKSDSQEQISQRTAATLNEIHRICEYDYYVVNDDDKLDDAVQAVKDIMKAEHCKKIFSLAAHKHKVNSHSLKMIKKYDKEAE